MEYWKQCKRIMDHLLTQRSFHKKVTPRHPKAQGQVEGFNKLVNKTQLEVGQVVVIKREKKRKAETPYEPNIYLVTKVKGSTIYASRLSDGKTICQDASRFKLLKTETRSTNDEEARMSKPTQIPPAYCSQQSEIATQRNEVVGNRENNSHSLGDHTEHIDQCLKDT